jgi:hypothetical protein
MNLTNSANGKVNAIALQVMQAVNAEREDHTKTMELLKTLQTAIQETRKNS